MNEHYQRRHPVTGELYLPRQAMRYSELPTFMRTPLAENLAQVDIALVAASMMYEILCPMAEAFAARRR